MHIGHVRTRGPRIGRDVVDPRNVVVGPAGSIFTAEHVNLVRRRIIDCRSHDRCLRHAHHRSPGVSTRVVTVHYRQGHPRTKRVTTSCIEVGAVRSAGRAIQVGRHVRHILPRPGRASRLAGGRRGRRTCYRRCRSGRGTALQDVALPASSRATTAIAEVLGKGGVVLLYSGRGRRVTVGYCAIDHVKAGLPLIQPQLEVGTAIPREVL